MGPDVHRDLPVERRATRGMPHDPRASYRLPMPPDVMSHCDRNGYPAFHHSLSAVPQAEKLNSLFCQPAIFQVRVLGIEALQREGQRLIFTLSPLRGLNTTPRVRVF